MGKRNAHGLDFTKLLGRMLLGGLIGALVVTGARLIIPRTYTSTSVLLFPGAKAGSGGGGDAGGAGAGGAGGTADQPSLPLMQGVLSVPQPGTSPSTAALILQSRKTTVELIKQYGLDKEWRLPMERAIEYFHRYFICTEGKSGDLRIAYTDRTPLRSQQMIGTAIELLNESVEDLSLDQAARNVEYLTKNLKEAEASCETIQNEIVRLQRSVGGAPPETQIQGLGQLQRDLQKELSSAEVEAAVAATNAKASSDVAKKILETAQDPANSDKALISILYRNVADRETELAVLREKYTDRRPEVVQAKQALDAAKKALEVEAERQVQSIQSGASPLVKDALVSMVTTQARVDGLRESAKEVRAKLDVLPAAQAKYNQLTADLRDERTRVTVLRTELLRARLIAQTRGPQFVMVDPPTMPKRPNGYDLYVFSLIGLGAGMVVTLFLALVARLRRQFREMAI